MADSDAQDRVDFELVFNQMPGMCLILDTTFKILAQNSEHMRMTLSLGKNVVGQNLFDAFPGGLNASGVSSVRHSLMNVLKTREQDVMPLIRYDVDSGNGKFQDRYWAISNTPILGNDGNVRWIVNRAENVTALVHLRMEELVDDSEIEESD